MPNKKQSAIIRVSDELIDLLIHRIVTKGGVKIINFGIFKLKKGKTTGFNPYTQKKQKFRSNIKIKFTPCRQLKLDIQKWK